MTTTTTKTTDRSPGMVETLRLAYQALVKAGTNSVRAAWRFGQVVDGFTDAYTLPELAEFLDLSGGTLQRYRRLYLAYQRPDLAVAASDLLETYNIDLLVRLKDQQEPMPPGRPMAGRRYVYTCRNCHSHEVGRDEIDPDTGQVIPRDGD